MAEGSFGIESVSGSDVGSGSELETGGRRLHNMNKCPSGQVYDKKEKRCKKQKK